MSGGYYISYREDLNSKFTYSMWVPHSTGILLVDQNSWDRCTLGRLVESKGEGDNGLSLIVLSDVIEYTIKRDLQEGMGLKKKKYHNNVNIQIQPYHLLQFDCGIPAFIRINIGYEPMLKEVEDYLGIKEEEKPTLIKPNRLDTKMRKLKNQLASAQQEFNLEKSKKIIRKMRRLEREISEETLCNLEKTVIAA